MNNQSQTQNAAAQPATQPAAQPAAAPAQPAVIVNQTERLRVALASLDAIRVAAGDEKETLRNICAILGWSWWANSRRAIEQEARRVVALAETPAAIRDLAGSVRSCGSELGRIANAVEYVFHDQIEAGKAATKAAAKAKAQAAKAKAQAAKAKAKDDSEAADDEADE